MEEQRSEEQLKKSAALIRELERKSNDTVRVHNPTTTAFTITYGGFNWVVPPVTENKGFGNGNNDLPRHVADNYITHMADKILTTWADNHIDSINAQRKKRGQPILTPLEREVEETPYRIDNPEKRAEVIKSLWVGLITKYGGDLPLEKAPLIRDTRPLDQRILDDLESKPMESVTTTEAPTEVVASPPEDLEAKKESLAKEVS